MNIEYFANNKKKEEEIKINKINKFHSGQSQHREQTLKKWKKKSFHTYGYSLTVLVWKIYNSFIILTVKSPEHRLQSPDEWNSRFAFVSKEVCELNFCLHSDCMIVACQEIRLYSSNWINMGAKWFHFQWIIWWLLLLNGWLFFNENYNQFLCFFFYVKCFPFLMVDGQ